MSGFSATQVRHALEIIAVVKQRGLGRSAAVIAVTCALAESSLMNWENYGTSTLVNASGANKGKQITTAERTEAKKSMGLGDGPYKVGGQVRDNLDSIGLFQQRPGTGWGPATELIKPAVSTGKFLDALANVSGWAALPFANLIAKVQGYYDPTVYTANKALADKIVAALY